MESAFCNSAGSNFVGWVDSVIIALSLTAIAASRSASCGAHQMGRWLLDGVVNDEVKGDDEAAKAVKADDGLHCSRAERKEKAGSQNTCQGMVRHIHGLGKLTTGIENDDAIGVGVLVGSLGCSSSTSGLGSGRAALSVFISDCVACNQNIIVRLNAPLKFKQSKFIR